MRIERHYGTNIVCGHIFHHTSIKVGQVWRGSGGSKVTVTGRDADRVTYMQSSGVPHTKHAFSFQCRYCLDIGDRAEVPDEPA